MKKNILISSDALKYPNSGLGHGAWDYGRQISRQTEFDFSYLLPKRYVPDYMNTEDLEFLSARKKRHSDYMEQYDLCHLFYFPV